MGRRCSRPSPLRVGPATARLESRAAIAYGSDVGGTDPESKQSVGVGDEVSLDVAVVKEALNALLRPVLTFHGRPPPDSEAARYVRSFLAQRLFIGLLGLFLPFLLMGFGYWVDGHPVPRDSLSAYYYSGVGALFVGVLTTIAFFLIAYRIVEVKNLENWLGIGAGLAVLLVLSFPTKRPDKAIDPTPLQKWKGDDFVNYFHIGGAVAFIFLTGLISIFFAFRERDRRHKEPGSGRFWWFHLVCTGVIWGGGLYILWTELLGGPRWSVFAGEFASFSAFGVSWLTKGAERDALFGRKPSREKQARSISDYASARR